MTETIPREIMEGIGIDLVRELSTSLGTHVDSSDLLTSISYQIDGDRINILMLPYWQYLEYGTPGVLNGQSSTVDGKTVSFGANPYRKMPVHLENGKFINFITDDENFALAKHIQLYGTQPYPFVRPVMYHKFQKIAKKNYREYVKNHKSDPDLFKILKKMKSIINNPLAPAQQVARKTFGKTTAGKELKGIRRDFNRMTKPYRDSKREYHDATKGIRKVIGYVQ